MRNSVSDEMLYLEAGGKEKTGGEDNKKFEFIHIEYIFNFAIMIYRNDHFISLLLFKYT